MKPEFLIALAGASRGAVSVKLAYGLPMVAGLVWGCVPTPWASFENEVPAFGNVIVPTTGRVGTPVEIRAWLSSGGCPISARFDVQVDDAAMTIRLKAYTRTYNGACATMPFVQDFKTSFKPGRKGTYTFTAPVQPFTSLPRGELQQLYANTTFDGSAGEMVLKIEVTDGTP